MGLVRRRAFKNLDAAAGSVAGSKHVKHAVAELFGGFQSIAEIRELILQRAIAHVIDRPAHVSNQVLEFEPVHRNNLDVMTRLAGFQGMFNLFERISVSKEKRSFFRCELNLDSLSFHKAHLPSLAIR